MQQEESKPEIKDDAVSLDELVHVERSSEKVTVGEIFRIHLNEPVHELSNEFCKYYYASNIEDDSEFLAIVYENTFIHPLTTIAKLHKKGHAGLNRVHAFAIVEISTTNSEHLVVIVNSYDPKNNLESYLEKNSKLSLEQIESMISQIGDLLKSLHDDKIYYANINPRNIIMHDGQFFFVREMIDSMPLYYQPNAYLAPELVECNRAAREHCSKKVDSYALGVTMYLAYIGRHPWTDFKTEKEYNDLRFENTTYKYLLNRTKLSERFRVFFRSTMHDDASVRWKPSNIVDWCNGKHTNLNKHESIANRSNQLGFNDQNYSNLKSLSHAFFHDWEKALRFIKDDKLYKWASREQISNDVLEGIKEVVDLKASNMVVANNLNAHTKLTRLLSFIDPCGTIRQMNFALSPTAIPKFLHYLLLKMRKNEYERLLTIIKDELWQFFPSKNSVGHLSNQSQFFFRTNINKIVLGSASRGIERLVYAMNPNARCMSKMLDKYYVTNLHEMIVSLDKFAADNPKKFTLDRNIVAFIGARLELKGDIRPNIFTNFPKLVDHPTVTTLTVMDLLQQHEPDTKIPNICKAIVSEIKELLEDNLHNIEFKEKIIANVEEAGKNGDLSELVKVLSNQQQFINDYNGYYEACRQVKIIENKIFHLKNSDSTFHSSLLLGQKTTVLVSYILCLIVTVAVML